MFSVLDTRNLWGFKQAGPACVDRGALAGEPALVLQQTYEAGVLQQTQKPWKKKKKREGKAWATKQS